MRVSARVSCLRSHSSSSGSVLIHLGSGCSAGKGLVLTLLEAGETPPPSPSKKGGDESSGETPPPSPSNRQRTTLTCSDEVAGTIAAEMKAKAVELKEGKQRSKKMMLLSSAEQAVVGPKEMAGGVQGEGGAAAASMTMEELQAESEFAAKLNGKKVTIKVRANLKGAPATAANRGIAEPTRVCVSQVGEVSAQVMDSKGKPIASHMYEKMAGWTAVVVAVGETVILLTNISIHIKAPAKGRVGCSMMTVSPTARRAAKAPSDRWSP